MKECVEFYRSQARGCIIKKPWLERMQEEACFNFIQKGFPTRQDEDWKYSSVNSFLQHRFVPHARLLEAPTMAPAEVPVSSYVITIKNGLLVSPEKMQSELPKGVVIIPLMEAFESWPEKIMPYLGKILKSEHAFQALNTAMLGDGLLIYIPENVCITKPLWISHWQDNANQAVHFRHLVIAESGCQVTLVEDYAGSEDICYFTNTVTEMHLSNASSVTHYKIQREGKQAYHVGHLAVQQCASSELLSHSISVGGAWVRSDITIDFLEPKAHCLMNGIYVPGDGQHVDHHTLVNHLVPECRSEQDYKGILKGQSRAVFNGQVVVAKDAQHTQAKQQNKNLLLSAQAEIDTKPQLEIFADDVICTHGATVGQLDEDALFYLATRGLGRNEAVQYLISAFIIENLRLIENEKIAKWVTQLLNMVAQ